MIEIKKKVFGNSSKQIFGKQFRINKWEENNCETVQKKNMWDENMNIIKQIC